jgi:bifunctional DNA-binding transcriptional regulator/antitoxin component of YhaV-PrlF toxin-antitoxin module
MRSTVSSRGQTAVPAEVRRRFNLKDRARLEWLIDGDVITVLPLPADPERSLRGSLRGKYSGRDLLRARARERARERRGGS